LLQGWDRWLNIDRSEPGLLPYVTVLRFVVVLSLGAMGIFRTAPAPFTPSAYLVGILFLAGAAVSAALSQVPRRVSPTFLWPVFAISADIIGVTSLLLALHDAQSDVYLLYGLPLLAATSHFGGRAGLKVLAPIVCIYTTTSAYLLRDGTRLSWEPAVLLTFPKEVMFLLAIVAWAWLLRVITVRQGEMNALLDISDDLSKCSEIEDVAKIAARHLVMFAHADITGLVVESADKTSGPVHRYLCPDDHIAQEAFKAAYGWYEGVVRTAKPSERGPGRERVLRQSLHSGGRTLAIVATPLIAEERYLGLIFLARFGPEISTVSSAVFSASGNQVAATIARINTVRFRMRLLSAFSEVGARIVTSVIQTYDQLQGLVDFVTDSLGFEYATISIADEYRGVVEAVHGKNVPPGWLRLARHSLDSADADAFVIRTGETLFVEGWDDRLDKEMYYRFEHETLARVFVPLAVDGKVFGVLQAGCNRRRRSRILSEANIEALKRNTVQVSKAIYSTRPQVVLCHIAEVARELLGADSASIHVYRDGNEAFVAGAGRATPNFLRENPPRRPEGLGSKAMESSRPVVISEPDVLAEKNPVLFNLGVQAIAAFPLSLGAPLQGVLYVHFWRQHAFSGLELEVEGIFVQQAEVAIQSFFQVRRVADLADTVWSVGRLRDVMVSLTSDVRLPDFLDTIAQSVLYASEADNVTLYLYFADNRRFAAPPMLKGHFLEPQALANQIRPTSVLWRLLDLGHDIVCSNVDKDPLLAPLADGQRYDTFVGREKIRSVLMFNLQAGSPKEPVGLLFVNYRRPMDFSEHNLRAIRPLVAAAAVAIRLSRERERAARALARHSLEVTTGTTPARDRGLGVMSTRLFEEVVQRSVELTGALVGVFVWRDPRGDQYVIRAVTPPALSSLSNRRLRRLEGAVELAIRQRQPLVIADATSQKYTDPVNPFHPSSRSLLLCPIVDEAAVRGLIVLEHPEIAHFSKESLTLVRGLVAQSLIALSALDHYNELDNQARPLLTLLAISARLQNASFDLDTMLRMALTGVTAGEGLGYSRASVLLLDEASSCLTGALGVGAMTLEAAQATWERVASKTAGLRPKDSLRLLLEDVESLSLAVRAGTASEPLFGFTVRSISVPLDQLSGALQRAMRGEPAAVAAAVPDPCRQLIPATDNEAPYAVACVPVQFRKQTLGVLMVDNRFLERERDPITAGELSQLEPFAELIASAVLSSRRWEHAQVEAYQDLAHQLQSPLATACKVVRDLVDSSADSDADLRLLAGLVGKARRVSTSVRLFGALAAGRDLKTNLTTLSPARIVSLLQATIVENEALVDPARGLHVRCDFLSFNVLEEYAVSADLSLLEQALGNIIDNALKYSFPNSEIVVHGSLENGRFILTVENDGELTEEEAGKCTQRYWRGESAEESTGEGSGIGLWIVSEIMKAHSGRLGVEVRPAKHVGVSLYFKIGTYSDENHIS
jgi:GAF domain-containing protein